MTAQSWSLAPQIVRLRSTARLLLASALAVGCGASSDQTDVTAAERAVEVVEYGAGDSTVVFESGLGNDWQPWQLVAPEVATRAHAFTYSRPGYGQSEPSPQPRDAAHIVQELRALLSSRGLAPPYLLVGHSFGGTYMELFAKAYREEVSGLVLVDPRHRDFTAACEGAGLEGCTIPASVLATLPQVVQDEYEAFARSSAEMASHGAFGDYPVRVLTATVHSFPAEAESLWQSMLGSLAAEATDGEQIVFDGAGHGLQLERAEEVAQVILGLLPVEQP